METKILALMNMGYFVDANLLEKGIYFTSIPCLYKEGSTIKSLVDAGRSMKDILGNGIISETHFENLKQCELVEVSITINQQTTSQQQTIERLLEELKKPPCEKCGGDGFILVSKTGQFDKEDCDKCLSKKIVIKEADQLFNTTEPIENFYCEHQKNGFMRCSKKCLACSDDI